MIKKFIFKLLLICISAFTFAETVENTETVKIIKNREDILNEILFYEGDEFINKSYETSKYGIRDIILEEYNKKHYKSYSVDTLTEKQAKEIIEYLLIKYRMDEIENIQLQMLVFDIFFNAGYQTGAKITQKSLRKYRDTINIEVDGVFGTQTIVHLNTVRDLERFADIITNERMEHYRNLGRWDRYGKGWEKRILGVRSMIKSQIEYEILLNIE